MKPMNVVLSLAGLSDFLIGAPWNDFSGGEAGRAYLAVSPY